MVYYLPLSFLQQRIRFTPLLGFLSKTSECIHQMAHFMPEGELCFIPN